MSAKADECLQAQLLLTAAFDGESDEAALAAAQRHLHSCAHCARRWEEWEKTRILLRSVPAAVPPSPLLAQVLLSCRLQPTSELQSLESELAPVQSEELYSPLVAYLQATEEEHTNAPLARFIQSPPVPAHLRTQILESTVRAQTPQRVAFWLMVREVFLGWSDSMGAPRAMRWSAGLAVPALAAWLIFAGQTETPIAPNTAVMPRSAVVPPAAVKNGTVVGKVKSRIAKVLPPVSLTAPDQKLPSSKAVEDRAATLKDVTALQDDDARERGKIAFELAEPIRNKPVPMAAMAVSVKKQVAMVRKVAASTKKRAQPLVDMVENSRPRLVNASLKSNSGRSNLAVIRHSSGRRYQISDPKDAPEVQTAELDFEEAFIAVTSQRDDRPEDLKRAFDEYRVSILAETFENDDELDDL